MNEIIALHFVAFVVMPITVESTICFNPSPTSQGHVCNWKEKTWVKKFDTETKEYYYTLEEYDENDSRIERAMRNRYLKKGGRYVTKEQKRTNNRKKMDGRSI